MPHSLAIWLRTLALAMAVPTLVLVLLGTFTFFLVGGPALFVPETYQDRVAMLSSFGVVALVLLIVVLPRRP